MTKKIRSLYIRTEKADHQTNLLSTWAEEGTEPVEWDQVKADPEVKAAQMFRSTQRNRQHPKRKLLASYTSDGTETAPSEDAEMSEHLKQMLENRLDS